MRGAGVDFSTVLYSNPLLMMKLMESSEPDFIDEVITDTDESTFKKKIFMIFRNPNLTEENFMLLAKDKNHHVRASVAQHDKTPADVVKHLLVDEIEYVRVQALWNPQTSMEDFANAVLRKKYSRQSRMGFCSNDKAVKNFEVFDFLWNTVRGSHVRLVENLNYAVREKHEVIDPKILHVVHESVRKETVLKALKESYAAAVIALPEILDEWKDDPSRDIINAIAKNESAWVSTHEHLVNNYRNGYTRMFVAMTTDNCALLNKIYRGTKSHSVRGWVENNPAFVDASKG